MFLNFVIVRVLCMCESDSVPCTPELVRYCACWLHVGFSVVRIL